MQIFGSIVGFMLFLNEMGFNVNQSTAHNLQKEFRKVRKNPSLYVRYVSLIELFKTSVEFLNFQNRQKTFFKVVTFIKAIKEKWA